MNKFIVILTTIILIGNQTIIAQTTTRNDTASQRFALNSQKWILPVALISAGVIGTQLNLDSKVRDYRMAKKPNKIAIDDYTMFMPMASVFAFDLLGIKAKHSFRQRVLVSSTSALLCFSITTAGKYSIGRLRPDGSTYNSFPSGHTSAAFTGAELVWQEYKDQNFWIGISGYAIATLTGALRVYNNRHWCSDVMAGAGVGILSTKIAYALLPITSKLLFGTKGNNNIIAQPIISSNVTGFGISLRL
ncbi:MAG: phosphatase PAP2 family protein [Bacteroidales bacterium]|nr:MAG: phosphatase PAP2 family protein [Bacteroidales bacterium]